MVQQRLPTVNADDGQWGDILNQYLSKEHHNTGLDDPTNGGHSTITVRPGTTVAGTAPLKFSSGPLLTTAEAGAVEFLTDRYYVTQTTSTTRKIIAAYDDTGSATGDVYYRDSGGNFVHLAVGASTTVLTVSGGGLPSWAAPAVGSGIVRSISSIASPLTAAATAATDYVYFVSSTTTITLPTAVGNTNRYTVKNTGVATVTIATTSAQTIDGSTTVTLTPNTSLDLVSDATNWRIT